ncbi:MAG: hypothetical protein LBB67_05720 [Oscillospiraceae bacterium]|nr:hypothetical protein [Oscillospiraceae bacterium]
MTHFNRFQWTLRRKNGKNLAASAFQRAQWATLHEFHAGKCSSFDPTGSYTGTPCGEDDFEPEQDADDL